MTQSLGNRERWFIENSAPRVTGLETNRGTKPKEVLVPRALLMGEQLVTTETPSLRRLRRIRARVARRLQRKEQR